MLRRQILGFGLVGGIQLLVDWLCFVGLTWAGLAVVPANLVGRVSGACLGYWLNGRFTFAGTDGKPSLGRRPLLCFVLFWLAMSVLSTLAVHALDQMQGLHSAWIGKPLVDAALAALGFLAARYWIYR